MINYGNVMLRQKVFFCKELLIMCINWIPFYWESADLGERRFDKAAMFLVGELPELKLSGLFQFDLGAPRTMLYENNVANHHRDLTAKSISNHTAMINGVECPMIAIQLRLGPATRLEEVALYLGFGDGDKDISDHGMPVLGSIGADSTAGKCLMIDYPAERMAFVAKPPAEMKIDYVPLRKTPNGHLLLPVQVAGEERWALFDTGSSLFGILTDEMQWAALTNNQIIDTLHSHAWGETVPFFGGRARAEFRLGERPLDISTIYYDARKEWASFCQSHDLVGIMGNIPFLGEMIVLDFPNERFGVVRS